MNTPNKPSDALASDFSPLHSDTGALAISEQDVLEAMQAIPGYLDISPADFRLLYSLARQHAHRRLWINIRAEQLMRTDIQPLQSDDLLDAAARSMSTQGLKSLPVVDAAGQVVGILTETDFLRRLNAAGFLELMLKLIQDPSSFQHRCHHSRVAVAMSQPAVTLRGAAHFGAIAAAFRQCGGRSLPVVDEHGCLRGLLLRKDFVAACQPEPT
jgi:CBS domain-containing membrane protein